MNSIDIIVFSGQSNMQGQTETLLSNDPVENAFEYLFLSDSKKCLADPVGENIRYDGSGGYPPFEKNGDLSNWLSDHALGASCFGNTNLVPSFCRAYINGSDRHVLAVHCAKGSTTISQWLFGTRNYEVMLKKVLSAKRHIEKEYSVRKIFFVWLQGESDALEGRSKEYYKERLTKLNSSLKSDIGIDRFGIIRVGHFTNDKRDDEIINAQSEICKENGDFLMLTEAAANMSKDPFYINPYAEGHFNAKGLERLGTLSGTVLRKESE